MRIIEGFVLVLLPFLTVQYSSIRLPSTGVDFLQVLVSHAWVNPGTTAVMASTTARHSFFFVMLLLLLSISIDY